MNTTNYNLYLEDDSTTRFLDWRKKMNRTDNSNMVKIDTALGEKANSSVAVNTTLLASAWVGVEAPYTQELTVTGLTALQNGTISVAHSATAEQRWINISVSGKKRSVRWRAPMSKASWARKRCCCSSFWCTGARRCNTPSWFARERYTSATG